tara:strand:+ start:270 stop:482 length:213 start_codon:yes stop_codon:yes gene_type:complete
MNGIAKVLAAIQTGKEEYPPIPKTILGLFFIKKNKDLIKAIKIMKIEKIELKIFFLNIVADDIIFTSIFL